MSRSGLLVVARTLLDRFEWAGNLVRAVRIRYYAALIGGLVAGDEPAAAVRAARRARDRDRVDIGVRFEIPDFEDVVPGNRVR